MRTLLPETFARCVEDTPNHWKPTVYVDILDACAALLFALNWRLVQAVRAPSEAEDELDLVPLLSCASLALDSTSGVHRKHQSAPLPHTRVEAGEEEQWAVRYADEEAVVVRNPNTLTALVTP